MSHVLITRAAERSRELVTRLAAAGIAAQAVALTEQRVLPAAPPPTKLEAIGWIAFTSSSAVEIFSDLLSASEERIIAKCKIAAVGSATAQAIRQEWGRDADLVASGHGGSELAQALIARVDSSTTVLYPSALETAGRFESELERYQIQCVRWPLYETVAVAAPEIIERLGTLHDIDAAVFYAPSAAHSMATAFPPPWPCRSIAAGETTARAMRELGVAEVIIAEWPDIDHIYSAIRAALELHELQHGKSLAAVTQ